MKPPVLVTTNFWATLLATSLIPVQSASQSISDRDAADAVVSDGAVTASHPAVAAWDKWIDELSAAGLKKRNDRIAALKSKEDVMKWAAELRQWYRRRVGPLVPLDGSQKKEFCGKVDRDGYRVEKWLFETMPGTMATGNLYVPDKPNAAGVGLIVAIGHWADGKFQPDNQRVGAYMAYNGIPTLVYDHPGVGERREFYDPVRDEPRAGNTPTSEHNRVGLPAGLAGIQPGRFFITEGARARDFLAGFGFVKRDKIGFTGASGGGSISRMMACYLDDLAFSVPVVIIRGASVSGLSDAEQAMWGSGVIGITASDQLSCIVPRPAMIVTEVPDDGSKDSYDTMRRLYDLVGAPAEATDYYAEDALHGYHCTMVEKVYAFLARNYGLPAAAPKTWEKVKGLTRAECEIFREGYLYRERPQVTLAEQVAKLLPKPRGLTRKDLPTVLAIANWQRSPLPYYIKGRVGKAVRVTGTNAAGDGELCLTDLEVQPRAQPGPAPELAQEVSPAPVPKQATRPARATGVLSTALGHNNLWQQPDARAQRLLTCFDRSLVGLRVRQILDFAADHPHVEELTAEGPAWAVPLAFATPLLPDWIRRVSVKYIPASFRAMVTADVNTTSPGLYIQDLLSYGDMDDVIRLAGKRLKVQYRIDADGRVIAE
jgi:hypothetical protein